MQLSIVTTLYRSSSWLKEFYRRAVATAETITTDFEIILVNDGSPDDALDVAIALHDSDKRVVIIDLSRNFGHHKAIMTGLANARGERVFLIDCDLEEQPELLGEFWQKMSERNADVIYGVQRSRKGGFVERVTGGLYYDVFNFLSDTKIIKNMSVVRLMTRRYVDSLIQHREQELVFAGLAALTGYTQEPLEFVKLSRGDTNYDLGKKINMVANSIASFSNKPLIYIFHLGLLLTISSVILVMFYLLRYIWFGNSISGWTSLIVSLWTLGGLILLSLGVIGIYLAKMFVEVKDRPYTIIRSIYRSEA